MSRTPISRRTLLKGLGAALSLPLLEAMAPLARAGNAAPLRALFISQPNGMWMDNFLPATVGALTGDLPPTLKSLEPFRNDFSVLSGLACANAGAKGDGPGDHARSAAAFLTGVHPFKTGGANIKVGISVDQVAANAVGQHTFLPSIEVGCEPGKRAGDCDSGYSCAYLTNISWSGASTPVPKLVDPKQVFDRLFSSTGGDMNTRLAARKSLLDYVREDSQRLQSQLGINDQRKLDEFSTSVREVERRIEQNMAGGGKGLVAPEGTVAPSGIPKDFAEHVRIMYEMLALAFQTDATRIGTFQVANESSNKNFSFIGANGAHHEMSHHGSNAVKIEAIKKIDKFYMDQFAVFLKRLKETKDGESNLLDNSMIMLGSGISDGDRHNHDNLPILLAGKGGGQLSPGRHVKYEKGTPVCNLFVSMLQRLGAKVEHFGDSTAALKELI